MAAVKSALLCLAVSAAAFFAAASAQAVPVALRNDLTLLATPAFELQPLKSSQEQQLAAFYCKAREERSRKVQRQRVRLLMERMQKKGVRGMKQKKQQLGTGSTSTQS